MVDKKLTELDAITSVTSDDLIYVVDNPLVTPVSKKITVDNFVNTAIPSALKIILNSNFI